MASELSPAVRYHLEQRAGELFFSAQAEETLRRIPPEASPVLDLGCGTAPLAPALLARGQEYVGTDRDAGMLEGARLRLAGRGARTVAADAEHLPFEERSFGAVASLGLFEYLENPVAALTEVRRVLRPGGVAVLTVPRRDAPYRRGQALAAPFLQGLGRSDPWDLRAGRNVSRADLESWALAANMELREYAHVAAGVLPWPLDRVLPGLAARLARRAGPRWGTARLVVLS